MYSKNYFNTKKIVTLAILSAIGTVLMLFEIPSFTFWLKFDLSDVSVYLAAILYGPIGAILVAFIKSIIHFILKGSLAGIPIDQFTAFISSLSYALPLYYMTKLLQKRNRGNNFVSRYVPLLVSILTMTTFMVIMNYFVITELYIKLILAGDFTKVATITHEQVIAVIVDQSEYGLNFALPSWIENSSFLPKDIFFWFIIIIYVPFNLLKATLLSALFVILSYRLDIIVKRYDICEEDTCALILDLN